MAWVDMEYISHVRGEAGQKRLEAAFLRDCVCSPSTHVPLEKALEAAEKLLQGELFKFVGGSAQGTVLAAQKLLASVHSNKAPVPVPSPTPFLAEVWAKLPLFFRKEHKGPSTTDGCEKPPAVQSLCGVPALTALWDQLKETGAGNVTLSDFQPLETYASWLSPAMNKDVLAHKTVHQEGVLGKSQTKSKSGQERGQQTQGS